MKRNAFLSPLFGRMACLTLGLLLASPCQAFWPRAGVGIRVRTTPPTTPLQQTTVVYPMAPSYQETFLRLNSQYPKYYGGFHSSYFQNMGIPPGDIGPRGNDIFMAPW